MDLPQLRYFLKVAELRSFTRAAEELHIAQPAVTRQVRLLEEELGVQLLHRHSKGAELTEAGLRLQTGAQAMLRMASETKAQVIASADEVVGHLRIGFPPSLASPLMGRLAATFHARHPAVQLHLEEGYSQPLRELLMADKIDVAVITDQTPHPLLEIHPLFEERLWVFFSEAFVPAFSKAETTLAAVARHPLIQPSYRNIVNDLLNRRAKEHSTELRFGVVSESLPVIRAMLEAGLGLNVSPFTSLAEDVASGRLHGRPIKGLSIARGLAFRADRPRTAARNAFLSTLGDLAVSLSAQSGGMVQMPTPARASRPGARRSESVGSEALISHRTGRRPAQHNPTCVN